MRIESKEGRVMGDAKQQAIEVKPLNIERLRKNLALIMEEIDRTQGKIGDYYSPVWWQRLQDVTDKIADAIQAVRMKLANPKLSSEDIGVMLGLKRQQVAGYLAWNSMLNPDWVKPQTAIVNRIEFYWKPERQTLDISIPITVGEKAISEMRKAKSLEITAGIAWGIPHLYAVVFDDGSEAPYVVGAMPMDFPRDNGAGLDFNSVPDETLRFARASIWNPNVTTEQLANRPDLMQRYLLFQNIPAVSRVKTVPIKGRLIDATDEEGAVMSNGTPKLSQTIREKRLYEPQVVMGSSMNTGLDLVALDAIMDAFSSYQRGRTPTPTRSVRLHAHNTDVIDDVIQRVALGDAIVLREIGGGIIGAFEVTLPPQMRTAVQWALQNCSVVVLNEGVRS